MAWYNDGTVAVTNGSTTVIGTGTNWVGPINAGYGFNGPDGRIIEIVSVVSATEIILASAYLGATQSGAAYSILPTQGLEQNLVTQLTALLSNYQGVYDNAGQGKFPDGTNASPGLRFAADEDTGLHRPASNQMALIAGGAQRALLSSTALQVDVPITGTAVQSSASDATADRLLKVGAFGVGSDLVSTSDFDALGATGFYTNASASAVGAPTAVTGWHVIHFNNTEAVRAQIAIRPGDMRMRRYVSGAWQDWTRVFDQGSVLGTVALSGGVPTGALFEVRSNANGDYLRFADGTQICWFEATLSYSAANVCLVTWTYPAAFIAAPVVTGSPAAIATATPIESELNPIRMNSIGATTVQVRQSRISGMTNFQSGDTVTAQVMAVGRWV